MLAIDYALTAVDICEGASRRVCFIGRGDVAIKSSPVPL